MAVTFNTNLPALTSQRYLGVASDKTASSLAKLSSGSRVPTAKDDAAALAVGSKLRAEVAGLNTAANNASQAVSLLQIADGALSTTSDILVRMKALAVQSSSGQLADSERSLLNQEFTNLRNEVDRIAQITNFNGNTLLNGGDVVASSTQTQAGYLQGIGITAKFDTNVTGADAVYRVSYDYTDNTTNGNATDEADTGNLTVTNLTTGEAQTINIRELVQASTAEALDTTGEGAVGDDNFATNLSAGKTVDVNFGALGVTLTLDSNFAVTTDRNLAALSVSAIATTATFVSGGSVAATFQTGARVTGAQLAAITGINSTTGLLSINIAQDGATTNQYDVTATTGLEFSSDGVTYAATLANVTTNASFYVRATGASGPLALVTNTGVTAATGSATGTIALDVSGILREQETTSTAKSFAFKVGTGISTNDSVSFTLNAGTTAALGISTSTIETSANATAAITALNGAINTVASRRADIGANQSRLDFAASSIAVAIENTTAAQSGLLDVDVSSEITEFTSQNVLLQAGVSLLAQANQQPALLLRLLQ